MFPELKDKPLSTVLFSTTMIKSGHSVMKNETKLPYSETQSSKSLFQTTPRNKDKKDQYLLLMLLS